MRVCIPTMDESGLEAQAYNHFGSAPFFTVVDTETGNVEVIPNGNTARGHGHGHGTCQTLKQPGFPAVDAVACRSMGRRALATLLDEGLEVFMTRRSRVQDVIDAVKMGATTRMSSLDACEGRGEGRGHRPGHGERCGHGHEHGRG